MTPLVQLLAALHDATGSRPWAEVMALAICFVVSALASWLLAKLIIYFATRWLTPFSSEQDKRFDAAIVELTSPLSLLLSALVFQLFLVGPLAPYAEGRVAHAAIVVVISASGWVVYRAFAAVEVFAKNWIDLDSSDNLAARQLHTQLRGFRNIANFILLVVTVAFVLLTFESVQKLGTGLLASAGVAGVILGFAAQRSISTIVAGVQIALTQPIRLDDVVIVEGEWGRVEEIRLTYVVVAIWDKRRLVVPVNHFLEKPFQNWTRTTAELLGAVELHVDYSVPVEAIREETKRLLESSENWDGQVCSVQVTDSSNRSMVVRALFSAKDSSTAWDLRCEMREKLINFIQERYPDALPKLRAELKQDAVGYG